MKKISLPLGILVATAIAVLTSAAHAQNYTWTGDAGGSPNNIWSNATNWDTSPAGTGNSTTRLIFSYSSANATAISANNLGNFTLNQLTFTSPVSSRVISGDRLLFVNDGATGPNISQNGAQFFLDNALTLSGVNLSLTSSSGNVGTLAGSITGNGSITVSSGSWVLSNDTSDFSGGITLNGTSSAVNLIFSSNSTGAPGAVTAGPAGTGKITLQQGRIRASSLVNVTVNNDVDITGNVGFGSGSGNTSRLTLGGNVTLTGNTTRTITLDVSAGNATHSPVVLAGEIAGSGSGSALTVAGTGTLELSGAAANTYTGNTTVNSSTATLLLNKTAGVNAVAGNLTLTSGTIRLGQSNQIADTSFLTLTGGTFDLNGNSETIQGLLGETAALGTITSSAAGNSTLTINTVSQSDTAVSITNGNGTVSLVKNGASTLILRGASTYSGGTTLNNGQIALVNTSSLGTGTITLNGGVLRTQVATAQNFSNNLEIGGNVQLGINTTNATMTFNGPTTILGTDATRTVNIISDSGTNRTPVTFAGAIGDGGNANGLTFSSTGTSVGAGNFTTAQFGSGAADTAANTYTGLTTVSGAQTRLLLNKADGTNAIAGNLTQTNGLVVLARSNQIANSSTVSVNGGTFDLGGNSETITALNVGGALSPQVANGTLTTSGGTNTISNASGNVTISANLAGTNDLVKTGLGIVFLSGNNSYSGGTLIQEGSTTTDIGFGSSTYGVVLQANNALGTGPLTIGNATTTFARLALNGYNQTVSSLSSGSVGTRVIEANGIGGGALSTLTVDQATDTTYSGFLRNNNTTSGQLALVKTGSGTLTFDGVDKSYTGGTTVNGGTLLLDNTNLSGNASVNVGLSGTLAGNGTITGATTIAGTLRPGNSSGILSFGSSLTLGSTAQITMELNGTGRGTGYDGINVTGALAYGGNLTIEVGSAFGVGSYTFDLFNSSSQSSTFNAINLSGSYTGSLTGSGDVWSLTSGDNTWTFTHSTGDLGLNVVPEPSTWALLTVSITALVIFRRRRCGRVG
jgi:autotransporter-associated beta strand protein